MEILLGLINVEIGPTLFNIRPLTIINKLKTSSGVIQEETSLNNYNLIKAIFITRVNTDKSCAN